jgi:hypothetical protein
MYSTYEVTFDMDRNDFCEVLEDIEEGQDTTIKEYLFINCNKDIEFMHKRSSTESKCIVNFDSNTDIKDIISILKRYLANVNMTYKEI